MRSNQHPDWHAMAVAEARRNEPVRAFELIRREILFDPTSARATCDGFSLAARAGFEGAGKLANWSVCTHPVFLAAWRHRLDRIDLTTAPETRRSALRRVSILSPDRGSDLAAAGQALIGLSDHSGAAKVLGWASLLLRSDVSTLFALAQSRFHSRDPAGGLAALDRASACGLPREQDCFWRARLLMATGRHNEADRLLDEAERLGGDLAQRCRILRHTARPADFEIAVANERNPNL
jgi:hypothetical protein